MKLSIITICLVLITIALTMPFYVNAFKTELERVEKYTRDGNEYARKNFGDSAQPTLFFFICPFH